MRLASPTSRLITASGLPSATARITCARMTSRCGIAIARAMSSSTTRSAGSRTIDTGADLVRLGFTVQVGSRLDRRGQFSTDHHEVAASRSSLRVRVTRWTRGETGKDKLPLLEKACLSRKPAATK